VNSILPQIEALEALMEQNPRAGSTSIWLGWPHRRDLSIVTPLTNCETLSSHMMAQDQRESIVHVSVFLEVSNLAARQYGRAERLHCPI